MLKIIAPFHFREDTRKEECERYWVEEHWKVVQTNLPECRRYIQNVAVPVRSRNWPFDGVAEIWFDDLSAIRRSFHGKLADELRRDERVFSLGGDHAPWMIVHEKLIFDR